MSRVREAVRECLSQTVLGIENAPSRLKAIRILNHTLIYSTCRTESSKQSPAVRFHNAYNRDDSRSVTSKDQLITASSSSNSASSTHINALSQFTFLHAPIEHLVE